MQRWAKIQTNPQIQANASAGTSPQRKHPYCRCGGVQTEMLGPVLMEKEAEE